MEKITPEWIAGAKARGERVPALTAYDYPTARLLDEAVRGQHEHPGGAPLVSQQEPIAGYASGARGHVTGSRTGRCRVSTGVCGSLRSRGSSFGASHI